MSASTPTTPASSLASASAGTVAAAGPGRRTHLAVRTLQMVLALFFAIASAAPKLVGHSSAAEGFDRIGYGDWYMYLVGGLEMAGAVALVIPILSGISALALMGLMIGAFVTQLTVFDGENALTPVVFFVLLAVVAVVRRRHNAELVAFVRDRV
ncbi:DoxX family protein [Streptomyces sp. Tu 2975]|uniref:DoxX family protein n=1 Tax=Streptomyces sp. Tu 2975 TaxID=2676871 RepID=UPI001357B1B1|nr:DoxX family protein [Streptomyces sp. Tu 2975]QIP87026.1 DoxX family protein [Streptomyces sp. Tu 2975]